jgi:septum formation protein
VHRPGQVTLGVDTTVHLDGIVYAKPRDAEHARLVLRELAGRTHVVLSGVCLLSDAGEDLDHAETRVRFRPLGERELDRYIASGEWEGRAGGYAIQGLGGRLVEWVEGDYLNVVGLPGALLVDLLERRAPALLG